MIHNILVIDDEWRTREADYRKFEATSNGLSPGFQIALTFLKEPVELAEEMRSRRYTAVLLDAMLHGNWPDTSLQAIISLVDKDIPIALLSSRWDDNMGDVNVAWEQPNCNTFLRWTEIQNAEDGGVKRVAFLLSKIISNGRKLDLSLELGPDETVRILHISDLQFGPKISADLGSLAIQCSDAVLNAWSRNPPHFVAITGDVAEHGLPEEYRLAKEWLDKFLELLGLSVMARSRVMVVPGNHDYCAPLAAASRIDRAGGAFKLSAKPVAKAAELSNYAFRPYVDFVQSVTDCPWLATPAWVGSTSLSWVETRFRHLGIVFYGLNTNNPIDPSGYAGRRLLTEDTMAIKTKLLSAKSDVTNPLVVIGLGHHSPVASGGRREDLENLDDATAFLVGGVKTACFLHGHIHHAQITALARDPLRLLISAAPTLTLPETQRPKDTLRGFSLLNLHRKGGVVRTIEARPFNYQLHQFSGADVVKRDLRSDGSVEV